jgi:photosystem II stability/assembly factor-like uncharacterized protein
MNKRWLVLMGIGLCVALATGGCGKRKSEEKNVLKPSGVTAQGVTDPAVVAHCEDPLNCIFFVCDATVPGSGAPLVGFAGGASNTLLRTADGGKTWQRVLPRNPAITLFEHIRFRTPLEGWAMSRDHLFFTTDGGKSWQEAAKLPENFYYFGPSTVNSNRYFQLQPPGCGATVYAATGSGAKWSKWGTTLPRNDYEAIFFLDDQHGWLAGNYGVMTCTTNGGITWMQANIKNGGHLVQVQFVTPQLGWIRPLMGHEGGPWFSCDGGRMWNKQDAGIKSYNNLVAMQFLNKQVGFLLVDIGNKTTELVKTSDGGVTWTSARTFKAPANSICFVSPAEGWLAAHDGTILHCLLDK